mmetsp:Transcript_89912/g.142022  ORF Transcript_89912/g.142022 Transcript_89912/m.142022 type:complete len:417 (-) Transcript_89912:50-1300(-)
MSFHASEYRPTSAPTSGEPAARCRSFRMGLEPEMSWSAQRPVSAPLPIERRRDASSSSRPANAAFGATRQRPASAAAKVRRRKQIQVGSSRVAPPLKFEDMYQVAKDRVARQRLDLLFEKQEMEFSLAWHFRGEMGRKETRPHSEAANTADTTSSDMVVEASPAEGRDASIKMSKEDQRWVKSSLTSLGEQKTALERHRCSRKLGSSALGMTATTHAPSISEVEEEDLLSNRSTAFAAQIKERAKDLEDETVPKSVSSMLSQERIEDNKPPQSLVDRMPEKPSEKKTKRFVAVMQYGPLGGTVQDPAKVMFECRRAREEWEARRKETKGTAERLTQALPVVELPEVKETEADVLFYKPAELPHNEDFLPYAESFTDQSEDKSPQEADNKDRLHARLESLRTLEEIDTTDVFPSELA